MKKSIALAIITVFSAQSFAGQLACWDLYAKRGSRPTLTANIVRNDEISHVTLNLDENHTFDTKGMKDSAVATPVTAKTSPYLGQNQFILGDGIRLILPPDLSPETLPATSFKGGAGDTSRQNGVLDVAGSRYSAEQGGDGYNRMHCTSK